MNIGSSISAFENNFDKQASLIAPASVEAEISINGSAIDIIAKANFKTDFAVADYRLGVIITENSVVGNGTSYDQTNDYSGGSLGIMEGYELLTNPIPASNIVYQNVGRALLGGYDGQVGSIPSSIIEGQQFTYTFSYIVPSTSIRPNMRIIVVLIDQETGAIVNAKEMAMSLASINENTTEKLFTIYPNPASENLTIGFEATDKNYHISINDLAGRTIVTKQYSNLSGIQEITFPINEIIAGSYLVTVSSEKSSFTQQVLIK